MNNMGQTTSELWANAVDSVNELMFIISEDYEILHANKSAKNFFNSGSRIEGKKCYQVLHSLEQPCALCQPHPSEEISSPINVNGKQFNFFRKKISNLKESLYVETLTETLPFSSTDNNSFEEKDYFKDIIYHANSVILRIDKDLIIRFINKYGCDLFGYEASEIIGKSVFETILPKTDLDGNHMEPKIQEVINDIDKHRIHENENITRSGRRIWVSWTNRAVRNNRGEITGFVTVGTDITEKRASEKALQETEERFKRVFENAPLGIAIVNPEGYPVMSNPAFQAMVGFTNAELQTKTFADLTFPDDISKDWEQFHALFRKEIDVYTMDKRYIHKDGTVMWGALTVSTVNDEHGKPMFAIGMVEDITRRKKTEHELVGAKNRAEESERLKSAFLANMSHEIRTPMNGIMGFSNLLSQPQLSKENRLRYIRIIQKRCVDLLQIINDILDISKLDARQVKLFETPFLLNEFLDDIQFFYQERLKIIQKTEIEFAVTCPQKNENLTLIADHVRIKQIITNLVDNAMKFTEKGRIEVSCKRYRKKWLRFQVSDTGIGIPSDQQKVIFDRFRQSENNTRAGGNGLGLAICKGLVELMHGKIWVESEVGKGSVFVFMIPLNEVAPDPVIAGLKPEKEKINLQGMKVLLVEDDEISAEYIEEILLDAEAHVVVAIDGYSAIRLFREEKNFDAVLMDIQLPDLDGYRVTKRIKSMNPEVYVVAQTAFAMQEDKNKCKQAGCDDYISKPIDASQLLFKLSQLL